MFRESENIKDASSKAIDYDEAFELSGHGWYNRLVLVTCCLITHAVALDMFGFSVVVAAARCDLAISLQETGLLVSAPFADFFVTRDCRTAVGILRLITFLCALPRRYKIEYIQQVRRFRNNTDETTILTKLDEQLLNEAPDERRAPENSGEEHAGGLLFAFPWGYFADVHGRRRALLLSTSVGFLFAALSSFSTSWEAMLALKLIGCCFSTAGFTLSVAYLGECTGSARRSRYQFYMNSMNLASEIVSFSLAFLILPLSFTVPLPWVSMSYRPWRLYTLVLALPLGLGALMMLFLYESPKFLANLGQTDKALAVMKRIYTINVGNTNEYPVHSLVKVEVESKASFCSSVVNQTVPLFKPPMLWRTLQLSFLMAVCCSTNNVFLMWFPSVVNIFFISLSNDYRSDTGFCQQIQDNTTVSTSMSDTEFVLCDDTISLNTIYSGIILGLFLTFLNLSVSKLASYRRLVLISVLLLATVSCVLVGLLKHPVASLLFFALIQSTAVGLGSVFSYFVDLYPTSYRGLVTSLAAMLARLSSFAGVNLIGNVIIDHCNLTFYLWAILTLSGVGVSLLLPSDRKSNVGT